MKSIIAKIKRKLCKHPATITVHTRNLIYRECVDCGYKTPGFVPIYLEV